MATKRAGSALAQTMRSGKKLRLNLVFGSDSSLRLRSICVFFFSSRRRHTRFDCDWSSDVCSSDLYFTQLRSNGPLWARVVIWTSILGGFLTVIGLFLGISQFKRGSKGRISPYRG